MSGKDELWAWVFNKDVKRVVSCVKREYESSSLAERGLYASLCLRLSGSLRRIYEIDEMPKITPSWPADSLVPVLADFSSGSNIDQKGKIFFLSVDKGGTEQKDIGEADETVKSVADTVFADFRRFDPEIGFPKSKLYKYEAHNGSSLALPALIASCCRLLNIHWNDRYIATGCWNEEKQILKPASSSSFKSKLEAAVRFGYTTFFVVEGQKAKLRRDSKKEVKPAELFQEYREELKKQYEEKNCGTETINTDDIQMEFVEVPVRPFEAMLKIINKIHSAAEANREVTEESRTKYSESLAYLLAVFDQKVFKYLKYDKSFIKSIEKTIEVIRQSGNSNLVKYIADDLDNRIRHYACKPEKSGFSEIAVSLNEFPSGVLGRYLRYDLPVNQAFLELDRGDWNFQENGYDDSDNLPPAIARARRIRDRIDELIKDNLAGLEDVFFAIRLANVEACLHCHRGCLHARGIDGNKTALAEMEKAWHLLTKYEYIWKDVFRRFENKYPGDTLDRQRNETLECVKDMWHILGCELPDWKLEGENAPDETLQETLNRWFSDQEMGITYREITDYLSGKAEHLKNRIDQLNSYDLTAYIHLNAMNVMSNQVDKIALTRKRAENFLELVDRLYSQSQAYPNYIIYEQGLIFAKDWIEKSCRKDMCKRMKEKLEQAAHWMLVTEKQVGKLSGKMRILAIRTAVVLMIDSYPELELSQEIKKLISRFFPGKEKKYAKLRTIAQNIVKYTESRRSRNSDSLENDPEKALVRTPY